MKFPLKEIVLKNEKRIALRSPSPDDAENMLNHLKTTHSQSYQNLIQSAANTKLKQHIFVGEKGDYFDIADGLPQIFLSLTGRAEGTQDGK